MIWKTQSTNGHAMDPSQKSHGETNMGSSQKGSPRSVWFSNAGWILHDWAGAYGLLDMMYDNRISKVSFRNRSKYDRPQPSQPTLMQELLQTLLHTTRVW